MTDWVGTAKARGERVLIVDDQPSMRQLVRLTLKQLGFARIREAGDGREALQALAAEPADVMLLDSAMPGMDGLATLKAVRASHGFRDIPVIMLTGRADANFVKAAAALGVNGFLVKPITAAALADRMRTALTRRAKAAAPAPADRNVLEL